MVEYRIVVVGHGTLPDALVHSARMIGGALPHVAALGLSPGVAPAEFTEHLSTILGPDTPVLVLSDLRSGTPDNVANALARRRSTTAVVSNASIALLLEVALGFPELTSEALGAVTEATAAHVGTVPPGHPRSTDAATGPR